MATKIAANMLKLSIACCIGKSKFLKTPLSPPCITPPLRTSQSCWKSISKCWTGMRWSGVLNFQIFFVEFIRMVESPQHLLSLKLLLWERIATGFSSMDCIPWLYWEKSESQKKNKFQWALHLQVIVSQCLFTTFMSFCVTCATLSKETNNCGKKSIRN